MITNDELLAPPRVLDHTYTIGFILTFAGLYEGERFEQDAVGAKVRGEQGLRNTGAKWGFRSPPLQIGRTFIGCRFDS